MHLYRAKDIEYQNRSDEAAIGGTKIEVIVKIIIATRIHASTLGVNRSYDAIRSDLKKQVKIAKKHQRIVQLSASKAAVTTGKAIQNVNALVLEKVDKRIAHTYKMGTASVQMINIASPGTVPVTGTIQWLLSPTTKALGLAGLSGISPVTMALTPWLSAMEVAAIGKTTYNLWDILQQPSSVGSISKCSCGQCDKNLHFIIDRYEQKAALIAVSASVVGTPFALGYLGMRKIKHKFQGKSSEKHLVASALWNQAQATGVVGIDVNTLQATAKVSKVGCPTAIRIITTIFGGMEKGAIDTISAICANNASGINAIKSKIP